MLVVSLSLSFFVIRLNLYDEIKILSSILSGIFGIIEIGQYRLFFFFFEPFRLLLKIVIKYYRRDLAPESFISLDNAVQSRGLKHPMNH